MTVPSAFHPDDIESRISFTYDGAKYVKATATHTVDVEGDLFVLEREVTPSDDPTTVDIVEVVRKNGEVQTTDTHTYITHTQLTFVGCLIELHYSPTPEEQLRVHTTTAPPEPHSEERA